ncbi:hypothetical protein ACHAPO_008924 [Fusarium lateritium]
MDDVTYFSDDNVALVLIAPHAVFSVIATIFVVLRMYTARYITKKAWCFDEYVSLAALVANHLMLISECISVSHGLGSNMVKVTNEYGISSFLKSILGIECAYGVASGWGIAVVVVSIFTCDPVSGFWEPTIPRTCINSTQFYIGITIPNIIFDLLTVSLPIREIWRLQMGRDKKWAITSVFLLGGIVVIASIARLVLFFIYLPGAPPTGNNISQTVVFPHAASAIETCLAIIGACLPPCAPFLKKLLKLAVTTVGSSSGNVDNKKSNNNLGTLVTIGKISNRGNGPSRKHAINEGLEGSFERLDDSTSLQGSTDELYTGKGHTRGVKSQIHVQHEVQVESSENRGYYNYHAGAIPLKDL